MSTPNRTAPAPPVRLVVVDADRRVRESLASLVGSSEHVEVAGAAGHPGHALQLIEAHAPEVVIVDPKLPEVDQGLALIRTIRGRWPGVVVLAIGWSDELEASCLSAGADGFVPKTDAPNEFVDAVLAAGMNRRGAGGEVPDEGRIVAGNRAAEGQSPARGSFRDQERPVRGGAPAPIGPILHHSGDVAEGQAIPSLTPLPSTAPLERH